MRSLGERYLDLLEGVLTGAILEDGPIPTEAHKQFYREVAISLGGDGNVPEADLHRYNPALREIGWDYPARAFTMVGCKRLANFRSLIERALDEGVPGDIIETGVWRGGAAMMARAVLLVRGVTDRRVILADSFEGLPPPDPKVPQDAGSTLHEREELAVSLERVQSNFRSLDLLDEQVVFLKGWFKDTMPKAPTERLAVMRLDGDMYESTIDPLRHLYDRLSSGGFVIVDDYGILDPCKRAVHDFLDERGLKPDFHDIDGQGAWFRKT